MNKSLFKKVALVTVFLLSAVITGLAQVQEGYVKTRGRLGADGTVISGEWLSGAVISIKDRSSVLSSEKGQFSFSVIGKQYCFTDVRKAGYQLCDMDILNRTFNYSTNDLFVVMDTPDNILADKLSAERKIRRALSMQLQEKEAQIETLLEQQKITESDYQKKLLELYSLQANNEKLISEMSERYSSLDFDQMDEFHRKVAAYIQNGELTMADSLLNTKGSMEERSAELDRMDAAIKADAEDIAARQKKHQKSLALKAEALDDFAKDCYNRYEISLLKHQNDSASYWLQLRASKDTSNAQWMIDVASFLMKYVADYDTALKYYQSAFSAASDMSGDNKDLVCASRNGIGNLYTLKGDYSKALENYETTLQELTEIKKEPDQVLVSTLQNIGSIYSYQGNLEKAMEYYERSSNILSQFSDAYKTEKPALLNNMGYVYCEQGEYPKAQKCFSEEMEIFQELYGSSHPSVIAAAINLGYAYYITGDYTKALEYYNKALQICLEIYKDVHPDISRCYNNIGAVCQDKGNFAEALQYYQKALEIDLQVYGENHENVATDYNNIGSLIEEAGLYDGSLSYYKKALDIQLRIFGESHPDVAVSYNNIAAVYSDSKKYDDALSYYQKALNINLKIYGDIHHKIARNYNNIGQVYNNLKEYDKALFYYQKALSINLALYGEDNNSIAIVYNNIGVVYGDMKDHTKAVEYYQKALDLNLKLHGEMHPNVALNYLNLGGELRLLCDYENALQCFQKSLAIRQKVFGENHSSLTICNNNINSLYWYAKADGVKLPGYDEYTGKRTFIAVVDNSSDNPASKLGMNGRYILLEYGDWCIDSDINFYAVNRELSGKPKNIVAIKDGVIEKHFFESKTGLALSYELVDEAEKQRALVLYKEWKQRQTKQ